MGHGIAEVMAAAGHPVAVHDPESATLARVPERIREIVDLLGADAGTVDRVRLADSIESAAQNAAFVFEAAPERMEIKRAIFAELSACAAPDAVLATNTSVISITEIAEGQSRADRVVGTHWWNPPYLVPLVEVVPGRETNETVVGSVIEALSRAGKVAVRVAKDVPGFVGNRLQHALWREAFQLIDEGVCDGETVDLVVKNSFGLRLPVLGPVENADLVGLDLTLDIHRYILPRLQPPSDPSSTLQSRVGTGELGMKSGRGLRRWTPEQADAVRRRLQHHLLEATREREEMHA
jgi:3-hydroxybutyryl-CoA dehydrogenase